MSDARTVGMARSRGGGHGEIRQYLYFQMQLWNNFNNKKQNLVINSFPVAIIKVDDLS
jgi:hypothetical protein